MNEVEKLASLGAEALYKEALMSPNNMFTGLEKLYGKSLRTPALEEAAKKMTDNQRFNILKRHIDQQRGRGPISGTLASSLKDPSVRKPYELY